jgi:hypothetical protein
MGGGEGTDKQPLQQDAGCVLASGPVFWTGILFVCPQLSMITFACTLAHTQ